MEKMNNLEIDRRLGKVFGYQKVRNKESGFNWSAEGEQGFFEWEPSVNMRDAWEVAEKFNLGCLDYHNNKWGATMLVDGRFRDMPDYIVASAETAPMAISLAALKVIENGR
jgi:hypothetical protein